MRLHAMLVLVALTVAAVRDSYPQSRVDTLPAPVRDSVLDAVIAELVLANHVQVPSIAAHTYLSPYRGFGAGDTLALHDRAWLDRVRQRYSFAGICAWSGSYPCPEGNEALLLAVTEPKLLPNGLVLVTMFRLIEHGHTWGGVTTPVYLSRTQGDWEVLCRAMSIYDDGSR